MWCNRKNDSFPNWSKPGGLTLGLQVMKPEDGDWRSLQKNSRSRIKDMICLMTSGSQFGKNTILNIFTIVLTFRSTQQCPKTAGEENRIFLWWENDFFRLKLCKISTFYGFYYTVF